MAICERKSREIVLSEVKEGRSRSAPIPDCDKQGESRVAIAHTHADYDQSLVVDGVDYNETFSPGDKEISNNLSIQEGHVMPNYVGTPRGTGGNCQLHER